MLVLLKHILDMIQRCVSVVRALSIRDDTAITGYYFRRRVDFALRVQELDGRSESESKAAPSPAWTKTHMARRKCERHANLL